MSFFGNDAINRVNIHYGIQALAQGAGGVFILAFLLHAGVSIPITLATQAAILFSRIVLRPVVLPLAKLWGLKILLLVGTVAMAVQYPLLARVHGAGEALITVSIVAAIGDVLYWPTYHAYFAALGDAEHRGHQVSAREALVAAVGILAPLVGGWSLVALGPSVTFASVGVVQALAAVPLLGAPNRTVASTSPGAYRAARPAFWLTAADGWFGASYYWIWLLALFVALHGNLAAFGGAMALSALAAAICGLILGRFIDLGHGRRAVVMAYGVAAAIVILRALSLRSPWLAVTANALGAFVTALVVPTLMTATYNMAKSSPCPFRFHLATEAGYDLGCGSACLVAALIAASGYSLSWAIALALPGAALSAFWLWRRYPRSV